MSVVVKKTIRAAGGGRRPILTFALVLVTVAALPLEAGCGWLRWRELARTHVDLLERMAIDGAETFTAEAGDLEPGDIERMRYPLARAREFARSSRHRFEDAVWVGQFDSLLGAYGGLVDWLDKARTRRVAPRDRERARELAARVVEAAARVRTSLAETET